MALTPNGKIVLDTLLEKQKSSEPLMQVEFDRIYELRMKEQLVNLAEEHYNFQMLNRLLDQHAQALNSKVIEGIQIQLKKLGYSFSSEVEFIDFCKENIQRERVTLPYPNDITSYFLALQKQHKMPRKLLSVIFQFSIAPEGGAVSYSIEMY